MSHTREKNTLKGVPSADAVLFIYLFYLLLTQNSDGHKGRKNHTNM